MKEFNTTGVCIPEKHYMVDISERVAEIKKLVDAGKYFTINRARQYGKTTTLSALRKVLEKEYAVISLSFQGITGANFASEQSFVKAFCRLLKREFRIEQQVADDIKDDISELFNRREEKPELGDLFDVLLEWCDETELPIVLIRLSRVLMKALDVL